MAQDSSDNNTKKEQVDPIETSQNNEQKPKVDTTSNADAQSDALAKLESDIKARQQAEAATDNKAPEAPILKARRDKTQSSPKQSQTTAKTKPVKSGPGWIASLGLLFSLVAVAAVAFFYWQSQLWLKNQAQMEQLKQQSLLTTQQTLNQQQAQVTDLLSKLSQQQSQQQESQQALLSMQNRIEQLGESQPNYWLAAEAGYLINLAERRLLVEQDIDTAMQLLVDANKRLTAMQDPSVFHIRQAISADIAGLRSSPQPNTDNVYLALSGLLAEVEQLRFAQVYIPDNQAKAAEQAQVSDDINDWQHNLLVSVERFFAHFITIKRQDTQVQPQLPSDQKWFVKANITTQLLMAQNAVLAHNQARFDDALSQLKIWLPQYFDHAKPKVVSFVTAVEQLQSEQVGLSLPQGLTSQPLVSKFVAEQLNLKENSND